MLNILENFDVSEPTPETYHVMVEVNKFAKTQHTILADPDFDPSIFDDVNTIISKATGMRNARDISLNHTYPSDHYGFLYKSSENLGTCHISIAANISGHLEAVSITTSINFPFGSTVIDPLTRFVALP
jgi:gamma-glutamyltranspeptidase/glutathione hydrolase/leukotriene-C4 hydrolase